jgi:hypothetical protein
MWLTISFYACSVAIAIVFALQVNRPDGNFLSSLLVGAGIGAVATYCLFTAAHRLILLIERRNQRHP